MLPPDPNKRKEFFNFINRAVALKEQEDKVKEQTKEDLASLKEEVEEHFGKEFVSEFVSKVNTKHKFVKETKKANKILVSQSHDIEDDFKRSGYLLYRGSSTVIYAILAGLKPFYVHVHGEVEIDPIYTLEAWKEKVECVEDLLKKLKKPIKFLKM